MRLRSSISLCVLFAAIVSLAQMNLSERAEMTRRLVIAAVERASVKVRYVPDWVRISYPGGDVAADTGVCTDEIIRIYRKVGIDLQKDVHEDMAANLGAYSVRHTDTSMDHRRVSNLLVFFRRNGEVLKNSRQASDYAPGDVVIWELDNGRLHIGMVTDKKPLLFDRFEVLHNIGEGPKIEDVLMEWKVIGHFRYYGVTVPIRNVRPLRLEGTSPR